MGAKYTALDIASLFIQLANDIDDTIDNLKLNKLLYYAQGWSLARNGKPLFKDEIQAWDYGPVVDDVYHAYKVCRKAPIQEPTYEFDEDKLSAEELELITDIYSNYGKFTSIALTNMTHEKDTPWSNVYVPRENRVISNRLMKNYFKNCKEMKPVRFNFSPEYVVDGISDDE